MKKNFLAIVIATAVTLAGAATAAAHDWYPIECCHQMDCAPADRVEFFADVGMVVTSRHGTVVVPANHQPRLSKDHRMHVCMRPAGGGKMRLICLFMPPPA